MLVALVAVFIVGYFCIAMEHSIKIDKSATALLLGMLMWVLFILGADSIPYVVEKAAQHGYDVLHLADYVNHVEIIGHLGDISSTLFFLIGAMTIVELIDTHGGFTIITQRITTRDKLRLVWILSFITFFMSSVLDNLTTAIVMVMLLRKLVNDQHERWLYASMIIIAANAGGAWSPIGDITTIMLWVNNNVTTGALMTYLLVPSLTAVIVPLLFISSKLRGQLPALATKSQNDKAGIISAKERSTLFYLGVGGLIFVPIFKTLTHVPPFVGILLVLGVLWLVTELFYRKQEHGGADGTQKRRGGSGLLACNLHGQGRRGGKGESHGEEQCEKQRLIEPESASRRQCHGFGCGKDHHADTSRAGALFGRTEPDGKGGSRADGNCVDGKADAELEGREAEVLLNDEGR